MDGHLRLLPKERKTCLATYRAASTARRALVLLLLAEGRSYRQITAATLASPTLIRAVNKDWEAGGVAAVLGTQPQSFVVASWLLIVVRWLTPPPIVVYEGKTGRSALKDTLGHESGNSQRGCCQTNVDEKEDSLGNVSRGDWRSFEPLVVAYIDAALSPIAQTVAAARVVRMSA